MNVPVILFNMTLVEEHASVIGRPNSSRYIARSDPFADVVVSLKMETLPDSAE